MTEFIQSLSSAAPVPGGGGASALIGSIGAALCSMAARLTSGKKRYALYQADIEEALQRSDASMHQLMKLAQKDAEAFEPLARAYGIPKNDPNREAVLESALVRACAAPLEMLEEIDKLSDVLDVLAAKCSRLTVSDVGVAAAALRAAAEGAALNVYINTKGMRNRPDAPEMNRKAAAFIECIVPKCESVYSRVREGLMTS